MGLGTYRSPSGQTPLFGPDLHFVLRYLLAFAGKARSINTFPKGQSVHDHDEPHDGHSSVNTHAGLLFLLTTGSASLQASISSRYMWPSWIRCRGAQPWGAAGANDSKAVTRKARPGEAS